MTTLDLVHVDDATNAVTSLHIGECFVDLVERLPVSDELINLELAGHVIVDKVGQLTAALDATKGATLPYTTSDKLECCDHMLADVLLLVHTPVIDLRLVLISWPAAATPMTMLSPQPLWQASRALLMTCTLPVQSNV